MVKTHGFPVKIFPTKPIHWHQELEQKRRDDFEKKQMDDMVREERLMAEAARRASATMRSTDPAMFRKWSMFWIGTKYLHVDI